MTDGYDFVVIGSGPAGEDQSGGEDQGDELASVSARFALDGGPYLGECFGCFDPDRGGVLAGRTCRVRRPSDRCFPLPPKRRRTPQVNNQKGADQQR